MNGKVYFLKTKNTKSDKFGMIYEVKSNVDQIFNFDSNGTRAIGISGNFEIMEWKIEKGDKKKKRQENDFLLNKPTYLMIKIKFGKILVNSTMTMGLDLLGDIFVWGNHQDGLLGLGYNVTDVDIPTRLESLKNINEIAMCESHALAIDNNGSVFSWGQGKYGELCLEKTIYSPFPAKMNSQKTYKKAYCGELLTCLIDSENRFSYFGVIIKVFKKSNYKITFKNLWKDEANLDPNYIFKEKIIIELETERIVDILIANGFIALLTEKGAMYAIDYSDNITLLYSKYFIFSSAISNNQLYSLSKEKNDPNSLYFTRWEPRSDKQSNEAPEAWNTFLYKVREEFCKELDISFLSNRNNDLLLLLHNSINTGKNEINHGKSQIFSKTTDKSIDYVLATKFSESWDRSGFLGMDTLNNINILIFVSSFDDSYNIKYKRIKNVDGMRNVKSSTNVINLSTTNFERNLRKAEMKFNTSMIIEDNRNYFSNSSEKNPRFKNSTKAGLGFPDNNKTSDNDSDNEKLTKITKQYSNLSPIGKKRESNNFLSYIYDNPDRTTGKDTAFFNFQLNTNEGFVDLGKSKIEALPYDNKEKKVFKFTAEKVSDLYYFFEIINLTFIKRYYYDIFGLKKKNKLIIDYLISNPTIHFPNINQEDENIDSRKPSERLSLAFKEMYLKKNVEILVSMIEKDYDKFKTELKKHTFNIFRKNKKKNKINVSNSPDKEMIYVKANINSKSPKTKNTKNTTNLKNKPKNEQDLYLIENNSAHPNYLINEINEPNILSNVDSVKTIDQLTLRSQNEVFAEKHHISSNQPENFQKVNTDSYHKIIDKLSTGNKNVHINSVDPSYRTEIKSPQTIVHNKSNSFFKQTTNNEKNHNPYEYANSNAIKKNEIQKNDYKQSHESKMNLKENQDCNESFVSKLGKSLSNEIQIESKNLIMTPSQSENSSDVYNRSRFNNKSSHYVEKRNISNNLQFTTDSNQVEEDVKAPTYFSKVKFMKKNESRPNDFNEKSRKNIINIDNPNAEKGSERITNHNASMNIFNINNTQETIDKKDILEKEAEEINNNLILVIKEHNEQTDQNFIRNERINENMHENISTIEFKNSLVLSQNFDKTELFSENYRNCNNSAEKNNSLINSETEILVKQKSNRTKTRFTKKEKEAINLADNILYFNKCNSNESKLNENNSEIIGNKESPHKIDIFSQTYNSSQKSNMIENMNNENNMNFSEIVHQNKSYTEENFYNNKSKNSKAKEEIVKNNLNDFKQEIKPKTYNFNLDLQNVLNKLPKAEEDVNQANKGVVKETINKGTDNNLVNLPHKKFKIRKNSEDHQIKEAILNEGFNDSPNNSNNLKRFTEQSPMKSLNERPNRNTVDTDNKVKKITEQASFNVNIGSFSNLSKDEIKNSSSKQSENISLENSKDNNKGEFVFCKFNDKNINLPLSTNFNNIIYTPRFKNRNNNQSHDTLNSEKNSPGKKEQSIYRNQKFEENNRPIKLNLPTTQKTDLSNTNKNVERKSSKDEGTSFVNTKNNKELLNQENIYNNNSKLNLKNSNNSFKSELTVSREISIESRSPSKNKLEQINKIKIPSPKKNKEDISQDPFDKKETKLNSQKNNYNNNDLKVNSDNIFDMDLNKHTFHKSAYNENHSNYNETKYTQTTNAKENSPIKLKENSPLKTQEDRNEVRQETESQNAGNNSIYLKKKSQDKFSNRSISNNPNQTNELKYQNDSQNIYLNTQVFPHSANKSINLNLDPNNSAIYFKPNYMMDNFFQTNSINTVELLMSNRTINCNNKNEENHPIKIEDNDENSIKLIDSKKDINSNKNVLINVNKFFEEDKYEDEKSIKQIRKINDDNIFTEKDVDSSLENSHNLYDNSHFTITKNTYENLNTKDNGMRTYETTHHKRVYSHDFNRTNFMETNKNLINTQTPNNSVFVNDYNNLNIGDFKKFTAEIKPKIVEKNKSSKKKKESSKNRNKNAANQMNYNKSSGKNILNYPSKKSEGRQEKSKEILVNSYFDKDLKLSNSLNYSRLNKVYETPKSYIDSNKKKNHHKTSSNESMLSNANQRNNIINLLNTSNNNANTNQVKYIEGPNFKSSIKIAQNYQTNEFKNMVKMFVYLMEKILKNSKKKFYLKLKQKTITLSPSISRTFIEYCANSASEKRFSSVKEIVTNLSKKNINDDFVNINKKKIYSSKIIMKVIKRRVIFFKLIFLNRGI